MARLARTALAASLLAALLAPGAGARPGEVDPSFGTAGELMLPERVREIRGIAADPENKLLVASEGVLLRVYRDGFVDTTFSNDGLAEHPLSFTSEPIVQPGRHVAVAGRRAGSAAPGVVRFRVDGSTDPSYAGLTAVESPPPGYDFSGAFGQADGGVVIVGRSFPGDGRARVALTRLTPDGTQDRSFGEDGWVVTEVPESSVVPTRGVEQPDGKLVVAGEAARMDTFDRPGPPDYRWTLLRYHPDGRLDTTFDGDGIAQDYFGGHGGGLTGVVAAPDGRLVLGGSVPATDGTNNALSSLARARADGSRDPAFDGDGLMQLPLPPRPTDDPTWMQGAHVALQPGGRIAVAAQHLAVVDEGRRARAGWVLARLLANGELDEDFGDGGFASTAFGNSFMRPRAVVSNGDRLIVAGESADCDSSRSALIAFDASSERTDETGPVMRICSPVVRPEPDGDLPIEVQCPVVEQVCSGTETAEIPASELSSARRKAPALRIGSRRFRLAGGRTAKLRVRASRAGRRVFRRRATTRVVVALTARDARGRTFPLRRAVQVRR